MLKLPKGLEVSLEKTQAEIETVAVENAQNDGYIGNGNIDIFTMPNQAHLKEELKDELSVSEVEPSQLNINKTCIAVYKFSDEDRKKFEDEVQDAPSPYDGCAAEAIEYAFTNIDKLPSDYRKFAHQCGTDPSAPKFIITLNCPVDRNKGSPPVNGELSEDKTGFVAETFSQMNVLIKGHYPVAMHNEWREEVVQNVYQIPELARTQSSGSSNVILGLHGDDLTSGDARCGNTMMRMLQVPDPGPETILADAKAAISWMEVAGLHCHLDVLRSNKASVILPHSQRGGKTINELEPNQPHFLLCGSDEFPSCYFEYLDGTLLLDEENPDSEHDVWLALEVFEVALKKTAIKVKLCEGALIDFNNRAAFHGRGAWDAGFDESSLRWGIRLNSVADPFASRNSEFHKLYLKNYLV